MAEDLDNLDDFVNFIADVARDGQTARIKKGKRKGEPAFTADELATLLLQREILLDAVAALKAALAEHPVARVRERCLHVLRQALSSTAIITSLQVENPAVARMRDGNTAYARKARDVPSPRSRVLAESIARHATPILQKNPEYSNTRIARTILHKVRKDLDDEKCDPVERRAITNRVAQRRAALAQPPFA